MGSESFPLTVTFMRFEGRVRVESPRGFSFIFIPRVGLKSHWNMTVGGSHELGFSLEELAGEPNLQMVDFMNEVLRNLPAPVDSFQARLVALDFWAYVLSALGELRGKRPRDLTHSSFTARMSERYSTENFLEPKVDMLFPAV